MSRLGLDKRLCAKALGTLLGQGTWTLYSIYSDNYYSNHLPAWLLGFLKGKASSSKLFKYWVEIGTK